MSRAGQAVADAFRLERGELGLVATLALAYGFVLASLYVLKPARNALFLAQIGVEQLPYVLLLVAGVGGSFAFVYGQLTRRLAIDALVQRTFLALVVALLGFRWLLRGDDPPAWAVYAFYVWVALHGLISTSLVWLLANGIFTSRQARRLFGFIGTGGIAGAILGGLSTGELAERLGTENLLLVTAGLLAIVAGLLRLLPPTREAPAPRRVEGREEENVSGPRAMLSNDLLRHLAFATGLIAVVAVLVDVQFNQLVDRAIPDQDEKAAFFGRFFAGLSAFGFVVQLLLTPLVLRVLGVGVALTILPAALGLGSLGLLLVPGLVAGALCKSADGGLRHSVHKAASEVLFLPVPSEVKKQAKLFLDTTVDTSATGLGALLVLVLTEQLQMPYASLSVLSVALVVLALVVIRRLRAAYVDAFRQALERRRLDLSELRTGLAEAGAVELVRPALGSDRPRQVLYALELLAETRQRALVPELDRLLDHPNDEVRRRALELRAPLSPPIPAPQLEARLEDAAPGVRALALRALYARDPASGAARLRAALDGADPELRLAAVAALAELDRVVPGLAIETEAVERWLAAPDPAGRRPALVEALAHLGDPAHDAALARVTDGPDLELGRAVAAGVGRGRHDRWIPWLMDRIERPRLRGSVRSALVAIGPPSVEPVARRLDQADESTFVRRALPRVLARIPTPTSVEALIAHVLDPDPMVARAIHRALVRLRLGYEELRFDRAAIRDALRALARRNQRHRRVLEALRPAAERGSDPDDGPFSPLSGRPERALGLLVRTLEEALAEDEATTLDLLALRHDPGDVERARRGLRSGASAEARSAALELLENVCERDMKDAALAVLDHRVRPRHPSNPGAALLEVLDGESAWLRACAAHVAAGAEDPRLTERVRAARSDPSPFVRDAATRALAGRTGV